MSNDRQRRTRQRIPPPPFPIDQALDMDYLPLIHIAGWMGKTLGAVKKLLDGRPDGSKDEIGEALRPMICHPFGRDRYIKAKPFVEWYHSRQRPA